MKQIVAALQKAVQTISEQNTELELTRPDLQFGDYATNIALRISKELGKNPREVAEQICETVRAENYGWLQKIEVAGPGFINISLTDAALLEQVNNLEVAQPYKDKRVVIETNNPNPFKDIHIGHAFNSIVADTVANLLEAGGADLHRVSYHGDVGLHVGKSLWAIFDEVGAKPKESLSGIGSTDDRAKKLRDWYARGAGMYEEEPGVHEQIEEYTMQSFAPEGDVKYVYDTCKEWSFTYFDEVFKRLGSKPIERRFLESETDKAGREIVEAHIGDVFEKSEGAIVFKGEPYDLHTRVFISKHNRTLYEARDLGLLKLKQDAFSADQSYIATALEQKEYFKVVFKAAELAVPNLAGKTTNIVTGTVKLTTGKMSSRTGQVVTIEWLFEQLEQAVRARSKNKNQQNADGVIGAIRYAMLKGRFDSDVVFDIEQSANLEGNTGPYLQYAHARACSILRNSKKQPALPQEITADERLLLAKISESSDSFNKAIAELEPHVVCTYLYELSQAFNRFYEQNRVIDDPREPERLYIVAKYAECLKQGLELLGIPAPEQV